MLKALRFLALTILIALALSLLAWPVQWFTDLSWGRIFRRCASIAALLSLFLCLRWDGLRLSDLRLCGWAAGRAHFLSGLVYGGLMLLLLGMILFMTGAAHIQIHPDTAKVMRTLTVFTVVAALVAVIEELVFRGYLLSVLEKHSRWLAVVISSAAYALVHLKTWELTPALYRELFGLALLGAVLALAVYRSGNLYLAIGLHAVLAYGARVNKLVIAIPDSDWTWFFGTSRLINGVLSWVLLAAVALILYSRFYRKNQMEA